MSLIFQTVYYSYISVCSSRLSLVLSSLKTVDLSSSPHPFRAHSSETLPTRKPTWFIQPVLYRRTLGTSFRISYRDGYLGTCGELQSHGPGFSDIHYYHSHQPHSRHHWHAMAFPVTKWHYLTSATSRWHSLDDFNTSRDMLTDHIVDFFFSFLTLPPLLDPTFSDSLQRS